MARFAALRPPMRSRLLHARRKLVVMRVRMAFLAREIRKVVGRRKVRAGRLSALVAISARCGDVPPGQRKARGVMARQCEGGRNEAVNGMATFAVIIVRWASELASMDVGVAVRAGRPFYFIHRAHHGYGAYTHDGGRHGGNVALRAGDVQVLAFERIDGGGVLAHTEGAGLEPVHRVTRRAIAPIPARSELALMRVRVAVQATREGQGLVEVRPLMAGSARHFGVFAQQRILGLGVVKHAPDLGRRNLLPGECRVAGFARGLERAVVRIGVAIRALAERDPHKTQQLRIARLRLVTPLAKNPRVRARQREACARVVKPRHRLPVVEAMAPRAVLAKLALVRVFMTGEAVPRQAQETPVEVLHLDGRALGG